MGKTANMLWDIGMGVLFMSLTSVAVYGLKDIDLYHGQRQRGGGSPMIMN